MHQLATTYLAVAASSDPLNVSGIEKVLGGGFLIVISIAGIVAAFSSLRGGIAKALTIAAIVCIGAMVFGLATTGQFAQLGTDLMHVVFNI